MRKKSNNKHNKTKTYNSEKSISDNHDPSDLEIDQLSSDIDNSQIDEEVEIDENNLDNETQVDDEQVEENEENADDQNVPPFKIDSKLIEKIKTRLKEKINEWLDADDKIKDLTAKMKKIKDMKKNQEEVIIKMITKLGMENNKIDIYDMKGKKIRSRVYRHRSVTRGAIKEDIIKSALMEVMRNEKRVDQLIKKIESKRPINERFYLKRTKGNKD